MKGLLPHVAAFAFASALADFPATTKEVFETMPEAERRDLIQRNSWDLVAFILSLRNNTTTAAAVIGPNASAGAVEQKKSK